MARVDILFSVILFLTFGNVAPWTLDASDVKRLYIERMNAKENEKNNEIDKDTLIENDTMAYGVRNYADDYEYQAYMEEKVHEVVSKGSQYLEGLRNSIEEYTTFLETCKKNNVTSVNSTAPATMKEACQQATNRSEHVRRLAELAVWAAKELQERASQKSDKVVRRAQQAEEKQLLVRLAWFLDKLAQLTGFEPETETFVEIASADPNSTTPAKTTSTDTNAAATMTQKTTRQAAPKFQLKSLAKQSTSTTKNRSESLDLLALASGPITKNTMTAVKSVRKRSIDKDPMLNVMKYYVKHKVWTSSNQNNLKHSIQSYTHNFLTHGDNLAAKNRYKRSLNLGNFLIHKPTYHGKPPNPNLKIALAKILQKKIEFLKHLKPEPIIHKRSTDNVDFVPVDLFHDPHYLKNIHGADIYNKQQTDGIIRETEHPDTNSYEKYTQNDYNYMIHHNIPHKPSSFYKKKIQIKIPEDPSQDISSYVKIKQGTNIVPDVAQAAEARLALERIFLTGNIETIRRYNANYDPLNPRPLYTGVSRNFLDIF